MKNRMRVYHFVVLSIIITLLAGCSQSRSVTSLSGEDTTGSNTVNEQNEDLEEEDLLEEDLLEDDLMEDDYTDSETNALVQSDGPAPDPDEGYCYLYSESGNIIAQIPVSSEMDAPEIMDGGSRIEFKNEHGYLLFQDAGSVKEEDDFFLFKSRKVFGDEYEKKYDWSSIYGVEESETDTSVFNDMDAFWRTLHYIENGRDAFDVDGFLPLGDMAFSFHSKGIDLEDVLKIVQNSKKVLLTNPSFRENKVFIKDNKGIEKFEISVPEKIMDLSVRKGGSEIEFDYTNTIELSDTYKSIAQFKEDMKEYNDIEESEWENYSGKYLQFEIAQDDYDYIIAVTEYDGQILIVEYDYTNWNELYPEGGKYSLLDQIEPVQSESGTKTDNSKVYSDGPAPELDKGLYYLETDQGDKVGQIRLPDEAEVSVSMNIIDVYENKHKKHLEIVYNSWIQSANDLSVDINQQKEENIDGIEIHWGTAGSELRGYIKLYDHRFAFTAGGYKEDEVLDILHSVKKEDKPYTLLRNNTIYLENHENREFLSLPIPDWGYNAVIKFAGETASIDSKEGTFYIESDKYYSSVKEAMNAMEDVEWDDYQGKKLLYKWAVNKNNITDKDTMIAYAENNKSLLKVTVEYSKENQNPESFFFELLDLIEPLAASSN